MDLNLSRSLDSAGNAINIEKHIQGKKPANNAHQPDPESYVQLWQLGPTTLILIERSVANLSGRVMGGR